MFSSGKKDRAPGGERTGRKGGSAGMSILGADVLVSGDLATSAQIHVDGRIDGNVSCDTLVQGAGGTIAGNIVADNVHLSGLVDGTVKARLVTLEPSARVTGDVTYETLSIAAGASIDGRLSRKAPAPAPEPEVRAASPERQGERKRVRSARGEESILLPNMDAAAAAG
jgi:cytoskeletal protein CcmA (bactofilin family)